MPNLSFTLTIIMLIIFSSELNADGFYKWTDARGQVQYSDEPPTNGRAKQLKLPPITVLENYGNQWEVTPLPAITKNQAAKPTPVAPQVVKQKKIYYKVLNFIAPKARQSIKADDGDISAMLTIKPPLKVGHRFLYLLDGKEAAKSVSRIANFKGLSKGSHRLLVNVVNPRGEVLQSSRPLNFTIIR